MSILPPSGRIEYLSNPNVSFMNVPTGLGDRNNVEVGVAPFVPIIGSYFQDIDPRPMLHRVNCDPDHDYWWANVEDWCPSPDLGPYTFVWSETNIAAVFLSAFTGYPIKFTKVTTGNGWKYIANPMGFVMRLEIKDSFGNVVYTKWWLLTGQEPNGGCGNRTMTNSIPMLGNVDSKLEIFPNPSGGLFKLRVREQKPTNAEVKIFNMQGKVVFSSPTFFVSSKNYEETLTLDLPRGVYFLRYVSDDGTETKHFCVEK